MFDIIILGAGLSGLTFANLCVSQKLRVALIDKESPVLTWPSDTIDTRCSAISRSSQAIFEGLKLWEGILAEGATSSYHHMKVWEEQGFGEIQFDAKALGEPNLGHIIENRVMIKALWNKLIEQDNVTLFIPHSPKQLTKLPEKKSETIQLLLDNDEILSSKLIIGSDGKNSWARTMAGINTSGFEYDQRALVATVVSEFSHQQTAWQRFLKEGPLAFLPLSDPHTSSIVWSTSKSQAKILEELTEERFCEELGVAFDYRLGKIQKATNRKSFPLSQQHVETMIAERLALIGDAAHVIHPLMGQGINLGLLDARILSEILIKAKKNHYDIGHFLVLRQFERARKHHHATLLKSSDFFKQFFEFSNFPLSTVRSLGMSLVNRSSWFKKKLVHYALGTHIP